MRGNAHNSDDHEWHSDVDPAVYTCECGEPFYSQRELKAHRDETCVEAVDDLSELARKALDKAM